MKRKMKFTLGKVYLGLWSPCPGSGGSLCNIQNSEYRKDVETLNCHTVCALDPRGSAVEAGTREGTRKTPLTAGSRGDRNPRSSQCQWFPHVLHGRLEFHLEAHIKWRYPSSQLSEISSFFFVLETELGASHIETHPTTDLYSQLSEVFVTVL